MAKSNISFLIVFVTLIVAFAAAFFLKSYALSGIFFVFLLPAAAIIDWKTGLLSFKELGLVRVKNWPVLFSIGLGFGMLIPFFFMSIELAFGWVQLKSTISLNETMTLQAAQTANKMNPIVKSLMMYFSVTMEEFVFRGYFLNALRKKTGLWIAVVLSSFLWGTGHLTSMALSGISPALIAVGMATFTLLGCILCISFFLGRTNLWLPFGIHVGMNTAFGSTGLFFSKSADAPRWIVGHPSWSPETGLLGLCFYAFIFLVLLFIFTKSKQRGIQ